MGIAIDALTDFPQSHSGTSPSQSAYYASHSPEALDWYVVFKGSGGRAVPELSFFPSGASIYLELPTANPLSVYLSAIEQAFALSKDELAQVMKATRKTIYNWLNGSSDPHKRNLRRVFDLYVVANDWHDAGLVADRASLHRRVIQNSSVFDLLCADMVDRERILFAGSRLCISRATQPLLDPFA